MDKLMDRMNVGWSDLRKEADRVEKWAELHRRLLMGGGCNNLIHPPH